MKLMVCLISLFIYSNQIDPSKSLIIYFSRSGENINVGIVDKGNTEIIVDYIRSKTNIISYKIIPEIPYPENYSECLKIVEEEKISKARPKIKNLISNIDNYDTILLGYPIWLTNLPSIVMTLLESIDFSGKAIYPFNTHEGSGIGNSIDDIIQCAPNSSINNGFPLKGSYVRTNQSKDDIDKWLNETLKINISKNKNEGNNKSDSDNLDNNDEDFDTVKPKFKFTSSDKDKIEAWIYVVGGGIIVLLVIIIYIAKCCRK